MTDLKALIQVKQERLRELTTEMNKLQKEIDVLRSAEGILNREGNSLVLTDRYSDFQEFIGDVCTRLHSSKTKLFETIGIDYSCAYNWVRGSNAPSLKAKSRLANGISTLTNNEFDAKDIMEAMNTWFKTEEGANEA